MSDHSAIEWTDSSWNPVTGCDRVSPGCAHCYALDLAARLKRMGQPRYQQDGGRSSGPGFGVTLHPDKLAEPLRWRKPRRVFVNSMSDLFHEEVPDEYVLAVWAVMEAAPEHTYQILTKRPDRMRALLGAERPVAPPQPPYERRPIPGWHGYYADTEGAIWSDRRGSLRVLSPDAGEQGHLRVHLFDGSGSQRGSRQLVHKLVLCTFDRAAATGEQGCHRDGNPRNNAISNLYWGTQEDNWADRNRHGTGRSWSKLTPRDVADIRIRAALGESAYAVAPGFGISDTQARNVISGRQWGFKVLPSVWLGVSIENRRFVHRADLLRQTPAAVRFISAEPLLGPLIATQDIGHPTDYGTGHEHDVAWEDGRSSWEEHLPSLSLVGIDWLIVGGESGPQHRPIDPQWVRDLRDACWHVDNQRGDAVAFFFKQWGGRTPKSGGRELDGRTWDEFPRQLSLEAASG